MISILILYLSVNIELLVDKYSCCYELTFNPPSPILINELRLICNWFYWSENTGKPPLFHYLQLIAAAVSLGNNMNIKHTRIPIFFVTSNPRAKVLTFCCWIFCLRNILFFASPICCFVFDDCLLFSWMIISLLGVAILFLSDKLILYCVVTSIHSFWDRVHFDEALFIIYKRDRTVMRTIVINVYFYK